MEKVIIDTFSLGKKFLNVKSYDLSPRLSSNMTEKFQHLSITDTFKSRPSNIQLIQIDIKKLVLKFVFVLISFTSSKVYSNSVHYSLNDICTIIHI